MPIARLQLSSAPLTHWSPGPGSQDLLPALYRCLNGECKQRELRGSVRWSRILPCGAWRLPYLLLSLSKPLVLITWASRDLVAREKWPGNPRY